MTKNRSDFVDRAENLPDRGNVSFWAWETYLLCLVPVVLGYILVGLYDITGAVMIEWALGTFWFGLIVIVLWACGTKLSRVDVVIIGLLILVVHGYLGFHFFANIFGLLKETTVKTPTAIFWNTTLSVMWIYVSLRMLLFGRYHTDGDLLKRKAFLGEAETFPLTPQNAPQVEEIDLLEFIFGKAGYLIMKNDEGKLRRIGLVFNVYKVQNALLKLARSTDVEEERDVDR